MGRDIFPAAFTVSPVLPISPHSQPCFRVEINAENFLQRDGFWVPFKALLRAPSSRVLEHQVHPQAPSKFLRVEGAAVCLILGGREEQAPGQRMNTAHTCLWVSKGRLERNNRPQQVAVMRGGVLTVDLRGSLQSWWATRPFKCLGSGWWYDEWESLECPLGKVSSNSDSKRRAACRE